MKIVLDTNVLISAFIAHGTCNELLEHCAVHHEIVLSEPILGELQAVLIRKFDLTRADAHDVVRLLRTRACLVVPDPLSDRVCRDPDDDMILATARTGDCVAIVTGDKDLKDLGHFGKISICAPAEFWKLENELAVK